MALVGQVRPHNISRSVAPWALGPQEGWLRSVQT